MALRLLHYGQQFDERRQLNPLCLQLFPERCPWETLDTKGADPLDEFVPSSPTLEDLYGGPVSLGKLKDGGGIQVREQHLHQLRSIPELFTGTFSHGCHVPLLLWTLWTVLVLLYSSGFVIVFSERLARQLHSWQLARPE